MPTRMSVRILGPALMVAALLVSSCTSGDQTATEGSGDGVEVVSATSTPNENNTLSTLVTVKTNEPSRVRITATSGAHEVETPTTAEASETHEIPVVGLRAEQDYSLNVEAVNDNGDVTDSEKLDFKTGVLPEFIPEMDVRTDADGRADGYTLVEIGPAKRAEFGEDETDPLAVQHVVALDSDNQVVWYYSSPNPTEGAVGDVRMTDRGTLQSINSPYAIRETDLLGNDLNYWAVQPRLADQQTQAGEETEQEDPDPGSDEEQPTTVEPTTVRADWVDLQSFHHEAFDMENGNILALANTVHELTPEQRAELCPGDPLEFNAISDVAVEFTPEGEVLKTWDLWDVMDVMATPGEEMCSTTGNIATDTERDWTHGNAVVYDPDRDAVIISARHTSQIIALDHGTETGPQKELRWILGTDGTIPLNGDVPRYQHAVETDGDNSIIFYDNGNGRVGTEPGTDNPPYSRAVTYEVDDSDPDPGKWSATQTWQFRMDEDPGKFMYAGFLGDADRLDNGNVLVVNGGIPQPDPGPDDFNRCAIVEAAPAETGDGAEVVWDLRIGTVDRPVTCYRAEHVASLYRGADWQ